MRINAKNWRDGFLILVILSRNYLFKSAFHFRTGKYDVGASHRPAQDRNVWVSSRGYLVSVWALTDLKQIEVDDLSQVSGYHDSQEDHEVAKLLERYQSGNIGVWFCLRNISVYFRREDSGWCFPNFGIKQFYILEIISLFQLTRSHIHNISPEFCIKSEISTFTKAIEVGLHSIFFFDQYFISTSGFQKSSNVYVGK